MKSGYLRVFEVIFHHVILFLHSFPFVSFIRASFLLLPHVVFPLISRDSVIFPSDSLTMISLHSHVVSFRTCHIFSHVIRDSSAHDSFDSFIISAK